MSNEYDDQKYEYLMDHAREKELISQAPDICYEHGTKLGNIIELTLSNVEKTFGKLKPIDYLSIAEGITESCWDCLDLYNEFILFDEVESGICDASPLYLQAKREESYRKR